MSRAGSSPSIENTGCHRFSVTPEDLRALAGLGMRRWLPVLVGSLAVMALAGGTALGVHRPIQPVSGPPPQLKTVPTSTLSRLGVTLAPAQTPPYCRLVSAAAERGLTVSSHSGCPIGRAAAEAAARSAASAPAPEAVFARASAP